MLTLWKVTRAAFEAADEGVKKLLVQIRGEGDEGDDEGSQGVDRAVFFSQLGVAVLPVVASTLRALGVEHGDEVALLKLWDSARSPTDLDAGETRIFSVGAVATALRLLADRIDVNAPRINLGGGATKKVNREGDPIRPGELRFSATTSTLTITYAPPDGGPTQTVSIAVGGSPAVFTPMTDTLTLGGKTGVGSNKVRAED